jgi:hypothetical protein
MLIQRFLHPGFPPTNTEWVDAVTADGPVNWYRLQEIGTTGDEFQDEITANQGTLLVQADIDVTVFTQTTPLIDGEYPEVDYSVTLENDSNGLTLTVDLNTGGVGVGSIEWVFKPGDITYASPSWFIGLGDGYFSFYLDNAGGGVVGTTNATWLTIPNGTFSDGTTYHCVYTNDGTAAGNSGKFYVNGVLVVQGTNPDIGATTGGTCYVSLNNGAPAFGTAGVFCELVTYATALNQTRVTAHYQATGFAP